MKLNPSELRRALGKRPGVSLGEPSRAAKKKKAVAKHGGLIIEDSSPPGRPESRGQTNLPTVVEAVNAVRETSAGSGGEHFKARSSSPAATSSGTGPTVPRPPAPTEAVLSLPAAVGSSRAEPSGSNTASYVPQWSVGMEDSGLESPSVARELVEGILLPRDRHILSGLEVNRMLDEAFSTVVRHAHEIANLHEGLYAYRRRTSEVEEECRARVTEVEERCRARVAEAEAARKASDLSREHLQMQFKKISVVLETREESVNSLRKRAEEAEAALAECQGTLDAERKRAAAAESMLTSVREETCSLEGQLAKVRRQSSDHFEWALKLERNLSEATVKAVEDYKASQAYRDDVAEAAIDAFVQGFEDFRSQVVQSFPAMDFSLFRPVFGAVDEDVPSPEEAFEEDVEADPGTATDAGAINEDVFSPEEAFEEDAGTCPRTATEVATDGLPPSRESLTETGSLAGTGQAAEVPTQDTQAEEA